MHEFILCYFENVGLCFLAVFQTITIPQIIQLSYETKRHVRHYAIILLFYLKYTKISKGKCSE